MTDRADELRRAVVSGINVLVREYCEGYHKVSIGNTLELAEKMVASLDLRCQELLDPTKSDHGGN